jgi:pimeloyl-ACP methyl ester carboxylesterase
METARHDDIEIAYETFGTGQPLLLIMGINSQGMAWPDGFCAALAARGFAVTRFDNRDTGLSTHFDQPYRLEDMALDAIAVLDALGCDSAHVVGVSMGGAIAQALTVEHPGRVRSLTSMMSWSNPRTMNPSPELLQLLAKEFEDSVEGAQDQAVYVYGLLGSPGYPPDEQWIRAVAKLSWERAHDPTAIGRHAAAVEATGDLRARVAGIEVPTLVLHGEDDPFVTIGAGQETAAIIPGARFVSYPGLGHDLPRELWPSFVEEIASVAGRD